MPASAFGDANFTGQATGQAPDSAAAFATKAYADDAIASATANAHVAASINANPDLSLNVAASGVNNQTFTIVVNLQSAFAPTTDDARGAILKGSNGLYVSIGSGHNQAAPGDHTHAVAVASGANGFLSGTDKAKLDGIATGATALGLAGSGSAGTASHSDHTHDAVDESNPGFMTSAMLALLDGLVAGANVLSTFPASITATGIRGQLSCDGNRFAVCWDTNQWATVLMIRALLPASAVIPIFLTAVSGYTGGTPDKLDGMVTLGIPKPFVAEFYDPALAKTARYKLRAIGSDTPTGTTLIEPADFDSSTNAVIWEQIG